MAWGANCPQSCRIGVRARQAELPQLLSLKKQRGLQMFVALSLCGSGRRVHIAALASQLKLVRQVLASLVCAMRMRTELGSLRFAFLAACS